MVASRRARAGGGWFGPLAAVVLVGAGGTAARADITFPHYFTASQEGRNVAVELVLQPLWLGAGEVLPAPRCDVELFRKADGGEEERLFHGPLGQQGLECPEDCSPDTQPPCCQRRCRTFVDVCPLPGAYTYRAELLDRLTDDPQSNEKVAWIQVSPASGACVAPPEAVISNEGSGCQTGAGAAWPHAVVLVVFGIAAALGLRRRQGQPGSDGSGTAKQ